MSPTQGALAPGCGDQVSANVEGAVIARLQHWLLGESDQFARVSEQCSRGPVASGQH